MVIAFGLFTAMLFANALNWTIGGVFMRSMGFMTKVPKQRLMPIILLLTLTSIYSQQPNMFAIHVTLFFGLVGYLMRKLDISVLPFMIAFILANNLEASMRQAFSATGNNPWFLFDSPVSHRVHRRVDIRHHLLLPKQETRPAKSIPGNWTLHR